MTRMPTRRASWMWESAIIQTLKSCQNSPGPYERLPPVLQDPEPSVVTTERANSSVKLQLRAWAKTGDLMAVKNYLTAGIFEAYRREGIEIPFPQMDIYIKESKETRKEIMEIQTANSGIRAYE